MDKVVLETFEPDASCFNPPPTNPQQDTCKVTVNFHNREDLKAPQPTLSFQREKDHYALNPSMNPSTLAVLQGLGFNEKDPRVQGGLHFSVFLNGIHRNFYPSFLKASKYNGPDLLPATKKMDDFIVAGEIDNPDEKQRKAAAELMREILPFREPEQDWFTRPLKQLLNEPTSEGERPFESAMAVPATIRPRLQWIRDQLKAYDDFRNVLSSVQDTALKKKAEEWALSALILINTGEGDLKTLRADLDTLAPALRKSGLNDPYGSLLKGLESYGKNSFVNRNHVAGARFGLISAHLKDASLEHRAELLSLDPASAFRTFLAYEMQTTAVQSQLSKKVEPESSSSGVSALSVKGLFGDAASAILPHITLVVDPSKSPRVRVDVDALIGQIDQAIQGQGAAKREYQIASLAVLRHLLGPTLSDAKINGWVKDRPAAVEIDLSTEDRRKLAILAERLRGPAPKKVSLLLPIAEGTIAAGGIALTVAGHVAEGNTRTPLNVIGPGLIGFGAGALFCHVVWKSSMPLLTDSLCGLGGTALGVALGAATTQDPSPPPDPMATRNPNTPGGSGLCKPPSGGCGP